MRIFERNVVGLLVWSSDRRIVLGRKHPDPKCNGLYPDKYVLPGGVYDDDESQSNQVNVALTETLDETGLDLFGYSVVHRASIARHLAPVCLRSGEVVQYDVQGEVYEVHTGMPWQDMKLTAGKEMASVAWVPSNRLAEYNHCPPSEDLFRRLGYLPLLAAAG